MTACASGFDSCATGDLALIIERFINLKASKVLCNCMNVSQDKVCAGIERGLDLDGLKRELKCGTSCGSCVPEIKRLLATRVAAVAVQA